MQCGYENAVGAVIGMPPLFMGLLRLVSLSIVGHTVYFLQKLSFPLVKDSHRSCQLIFQQDTHILPTNDYFRIHTSFLSPLFRGRGAPLFTHIFHTALLFVSFRFTGHKKEQTL